jgi:hypothetical protein
MRTVGLGRLGRALGVDLGQVEAQLALGVEDVVGLLEGDADASGEAAARVGQHGEVELGLLRGGERLIRSLGADGHQSGAKGSQLGQQLALVGPQRQVAVRAPAAPVEHDDRRAALDELVQRDQACRWRRST